MKKLLEYLPFHFTLSLIIGIASQFNFGIWSYGVLAIVYTAVVLFTILALLRRSKLYFLGVWLFFFFVGIVTVYVQDDRNYDSYYGHHLKKRATVVLQIDKVLKSGIYFDKFETSVVKLDTELVCGKILLNINKDSTNRFVQVGDRLLLRVEILPVQPSLNLHQFDYRSYLGKQGIYDQIFTKSNEYIILKEPQFSLYRMAAKLRRNIQKSLEEQIRNEDVLNIINALLLGQRKGVSKELIEDYSKAGAIHILAVSGLHVGILLLIFSYLLVPLESIKNGKVFKTFIVVLLLWMFAFIAGLSASVVRAVTMFTFVAFGMVSNRRGTVLFTLVSSAFFLLLIEPLFLFDVGFQLSYLAVFGIVWIQPMLQNIWKPTYGIIHKLWQLCTVSIAAQITILPLSLYYFHQFPGLFILSNLIIVPFLGAILVGGILLIILSLIDILPKFLVIIYETIIRAMNGFVRWIAAQEQFIITDISFSALLMISSYFLILTVGNICSKWHPKKMMALLCSLIVFQCVLIFEAYERNTEKSLVVFHKSRKTIVGVRLHDSLHVYSDIPLSTLGQSSILRPYVIEEGVSVNYEGKLPNYLGLQEHEMLIVDEKGVYEFNGYTKPIVLMRQSSKVNIERLIDHLKPRLIIADGSNYKSTIAIWRKTCLQKKTPFWYTGQNGAYMLEEY